MPKTKKKPVKQKKAKPVFAYAIKHTLTNSIVYMYPIHSYRSVGKKDYLDKVLKDNNYCRFTKFIKVKITEV